MKHTQVPHIAVLNSYPYLLQLGDLCLNLLRPSRLSCGDLYGVVQGGRGGAGTGASGLLRYANRRHLQPRPNL